MLWHGSVAARGDAGVLVVGPSGSGKSRLVLRLLDRGFVLVADDQVEVAAGWASPPPQLAGLLEVRGFGLLRLEHVLRARLVLAVACLPADQMQRLPAPRHHQLGLPMIPLDPADPAAPLVVGHALDVLAGTRTMLAGALAA